MIVVFKTEINLTSFKLFLIFSFCFRIFIMIEQQVLFYLHLSLFQAPVFGGNDGENVFNT